MNNRSKRALSFWVGLLFTILSFTEYTNAQIIFTGKVMDAKSELPLPYVNIGITDQPVGTLSNADGTFSLQIPVSYQNDSLLFTSLGYFHQKLSIRSLTQNAVVFLQQRAIQLQEVRVVADKKAKVYDLGNKLSDNLFTCSDSASAGAAMALLIENKFPHFHRKLTNPYLLQKAAILIGTNTLSEFKLRLRLLAYDSLTGLPGQDLLNENIIVTSRLQREGWLDIDLAKYGIRIDQPRFFLAFEWILDDNDRRWILNQYKEFAVTNPQKVKIDTIVVEGKKIPHVNWRGISVGTSFRVSTLPYSLTNYQCFYRTNSQGAWIRSSFILTTRLFVANG